MAELPGQQALFSALGTDWETPADVFLPIRQEFAPTLDVCANALNAKCARYFTEAEDGLAQTWAPEVCWMNPPYGRAVSKWTDKAVLESRRGAVVLGLLPVRSDTTWWHRDVLGAALEIRFLPGRVRYLKPEHRGRSQATFPTALIVWNDRRRRLWATDRLPEVRRWRW